MVKILDLSEHMGLRIAGRLEGISRIHPGYIGLRARYFVVTLALGSHSGDDDERMIASHFFGHTGTDERLLLRSDSLDYNPAWSPDGKWIAFSGEALIERFGAYRESERMFLLETNESAR